MYSTYILNTDELTSQFVTALQQTFPGKNVEIIVQEAVDETEYLSKDPQLLKAVHDIKNGKNLVSVPLESL
jgi:phospholipid N-methyltransferase